FGLANESPVLDAIVEEGVADARVVAARVRERLPREIESEGERRPAGAIELVEHRFVRRGIDDHEHVAEVFRRGPDQTRAADVDLLDELVEGHARLPGRLREWIQVDGDDIDQLDAVLRRGAKVVL